MNDDDKRYVRDVMKELWSIMADWLPEQDRDGIEDDYNECMMLLEEDKNGNK